MPKRRIASLLLVLASALAAAMAQRQGPPAERCCFTNPRFSGVCLVQPAKEETCRSILQYLNNPRSSGKTYCGNTQIRGGWKQVRCAAEP